MTFLELAKLRYSARKYLNKAVEEEKINYILECGRVAPSAANLQPWHVIVLQDKENLERISAVYPKDWFRQAPLVLVICGDHTTSWKRTDGKDHCDIDIAIITDHITLAAAEQSFGSCWICNFDAKLCSALLHLPAHIEPVVILSIGYAADMGENTRHTTRKLPEEILHREKY